MGQQYIVSGYIECFGEKGIENENVLKRFSYESETPFPDIFSLPRNAYQCSMIAFAGSFKNFDEDWICWRKKFESLLGTLWIKSASVRVESEMDGDFSLVNYIPANPININESLKSKCEWVRMIENDEGEIREERLTI